MAKFYLPQDGFDSYLSTALGASDTTLYINALPTMTAGYLTIFELDGVTIRCKVKYTGVLSGPNRLTGVTFIGLLPVSEEVVDTAVAGTSCPQNSRIALCDNIHYLGKALAVLNGDTACGGIPKNPASRTINDSRHLTDKEYVDNSVLSGYPAFYVAADGALTVSISAGQYIKEDGTSAYYAGDAGKAVTDNATSYVEMSTAGVISVVPSAFTAGRFPLAVVVASAGAITSVSDRRALLGLNDGTVDKIRTWATVQTIPANKMTINSDAAAATEPVRLSLMQSSVGSLALATFGDGSDGAFAAAAGTTTWNTSLKYLYQYTSFALTGSAVLTLGANLKNQPIIVLVQGDLEITSNGNPAIQLTGFGAAGGAGGTGTGADGTPGAQIVSYQSQGLGGTMGTSQGDGGGGGAGCNGNGAAGAGSGGTVGAGGKGTIITNIVNAEKLLTLLSCGAGGGAGGGDSGTGAAVGGAGGDGGGCIIFIVGGAVNISAKMYANGNAGVAGTTSGSDYGGCGGGGGGGAIAVLYYGTLTANTATIQVAGGAAGAGGSSFSGGAGGAGYSVVQKINSKLLGL